MAHLRDLLNAWDPQVGGVNAHVVSLYGDDILVYVQHLESSIHVLLKALGEFGECSGRKSYLFSMGALARDRTNALPMVGLPRGAEGLQYPGIRLAHTADEYYDLKHGRVLQGLRTSVRFWKELLLSVMGRVAITKMVILPHCLYGLQNTLYEVPGLHFARIA
ncbi:hypothetical protein NDU88_003974 [Pleurodeles waltl]|uniref:Reverse transcriptase domain-containing protein n=1 Tax=Pleurodeles waltl TaxID=8319 RepID=A0AAV7WU75_PLEWA|nr:hypothetical protein NDU88_003974 [Pleurodeles waltl]